MAVRRLKRRRKVFVSYQYGKDGLFGFGNTVQFWTDKKYISKNDIRQMEKELKEKQGFKYVVILNYHFM